jgi:hypothetical protein
MELSLDNLKVNIDNEILHFNPDILNSDFIRSKDILQNDMDQKVAETARKEKSCRREENMGYQGIRGYGRYTGCCGITGIQGFSGLYGSRATRLHRNARFRICRRNIGWFYS